MRLEPKWDTQLGDYVSNQPAVDGDVVYAGCDDGSVYAFNRTDGEIRREVDLGSGWVRNEPGPVVAQGSVFVGTQETDFGGVGSGTTHSEEGAVYELDPDTGLTELIDEWTVDVGLPVGIAFHSSPLDKVYVSVSERVEAYRLDESGMGATMKDWSFDNRYSGEHESGYLAGPAIANETVYVAGEDERVYALDADTGTTRWQADVGHNPTAPAVKDGLVYVGTESGPVHALDANSGTERWRASLATTNRPVIKDDTVFIATHDALVALDRSDGSRRWNRSVESPSWPAVTEKVVCATDYSETVYLFDVDDGTELDRVSTGQENLSPPIVEGSDVFVGGSYEMLGFSLVDQTPADTAATSTAQPETDTDEGTATKASTDRGSATTEEEMVERTVEIRRDQAEALEEAYFDLSAFLQDKLDEHFEE